MKRVMGSGLACLAALFALAGCGANNTKKVAIRVNKDTVTEDEFYKRVEAVSLADLAPAARGMGPAKAGEYAVEHIILERLVDQLAAQKGVRPTDAEVSHYVAVAKKYQDNPNMALLPNNPFRTEDDFKREARLSLLQLGIAAGPLKITQDEINKKYDQFKGQLASEDKYHLRVVQSSTPEKAQKALDALKKGVAFETVALTQSEDPGSKAKSGDIGIIPQSVLPPEFLAALQNMKSGDYTKTAIKLGGGAAQPGVNRYVILQLVEKLPGAAPSVDEAKYVIQQGIMREKDPNFNQRMQQDMAGLRKTADIQVNLPGYDKLVNQIKSAAAPPASAMPTAPVR